MIYVLMAREASRAVIFRRGPTRRVLLLSWDLETEEIVPGQWFKGRVYEHRCDLSPDGRLLIYFAAKFWRNPEAWTAISKPPYFTALALWMKETAWGGGGLFDSATSIALNHADEDFALAAGFALPPEITVRPIAPWAGGGEDEPVLSTRLARDGWRLTSEGHVVNRDRKASVWLQVEPPMTWEKLHPLAPERYTLQASITGIKERQGAFYRMEHFVGDSHPIGRSDWADWAPNGDLLFTIGYSIYRLRYAGGALAPLAEARKIADLTVAAFREVPAPPEARQWF